MANPKQYDGMRVVEHCVQPGQTYIGLASMYGLTKWQGIQVYNTRVRPVLASAKPEQLPAGRRILIPRSPKGYDNWTGTLKKAQAELNGLEIGELARLDAIDNEAKAGYVALDFASDILTLFGSLAAKGADAAKASAQAFDADLIDEPLANALQFSWANAEGFAFGVEGVFDRLAAAVAGADKAISKALYEKLFDKVSGKNLALLRKLLKAGASGSKGGGKVILAGMADGARAVLEYLDYLKPSTWNKIMLAKFYGGTVEQSVGEQATRVKTMVAQQIAVLEAKRGDVEREKALVWGG